MNETTFVRLHSTTWKELESALKQIQSKSKAGIDHDGIHRLLFLYQTVSRHLSIARTRYGATDTVDYLNRLVSRAHQVIYVSKPNTLHRIIRFYVHDFPCLVKKEALLLFIAAGVFISGFLISFFFTLYNEDYALSFVPVQYTQALEDNTSDLDVHLNYTVTSVVIFTNNIRVGIFAFALGITFGIGTVYVLAQNGLLLGALSALAVHHGMGYSFWSLILPHGIPELFCIFICGAAGLSIARSMLFPGIHSRRQSFSTGGKNALHLLMGTIPIFVLAGLTEGYITPLPVNPLWKYAVALIWLCVLLIYILVRRKTGNTYT